MKFRVVKWTLSSTRDSPYKWTERAPSAAAAKCRFTTSGKAVVEGSSTCPTLAGPLRGINCQSPKNMFFLFSRGFLWVRHIHGRWTKAWTSYISPICTVRNKTGQTLKIVKNIDDKKASWTWSWTTLGSSTVLLLQIPRYQFQQKRSYIHQKH